MQLRSAYARAHEWLLHLRLLTLGHSGKKGMDVNSIVIGVIGGTIATVPMTLVMVGLYRLLPHREQYPLPPREITENLAEKAGVQHRLDEPKLTWLTLIGHFAYGAVCGAVYAPVASFVPIGHVWSGIGFGLLVWIVSYLGLLPLLNLFPRATQRPPRRNALMIAAHVVWGAFLGATVLWLRRHFA